MEDRPHYPWHINNFLRVDLHELYQQWSNNACFAMAYYMTLPGSVGQGEQESPIVHRQLYDLLRHQGYVMHWIAVYGFVDLFNFILERKLLSTDQLAGLLNLALKINFSTIDRALYEALRFPVVSSDQYGLYPLHLAAARGNDALVRFFLIHGAVVEVKTSTSHVTPLHVAVSHGHYAVAQTLLEWCADPNVWASGENVAHFVLGVDRFSSLTPLFIAVQRGNLDMVRLLVNYGARVMVATELGETPLHDAAAYGHEAIIRFLLSHEADPRVRIGNARMRRGFLAQDLARVRRHVHLMSLLRPRSIARPCCMIS